MTADFALGFLVGCLVTWLALTLMLLTGHADADAREDDDVDRW